MGGLLMLRALDVLVGASATANEEKSEADAMANEESESQCHGKR